jgi:predicted RNase H-like HicB family nuclease
MLELGVDDLVQATPAGQTLEEAMANASENLATAAQNYLARLRRELTKQP